MRVELEYKLRNPPHYPLSPTYQLSYFWYAQLSKQYALWPRFPLASLPCCYVPRYHLLRLGLFRGKYFKFGLIFVINGQTTPVLLDLRTATPFTLSDWYTVYNCSPNTITITRTAPAPSFTFYLTALVAGQPFPAESHIISSPPYSTPTTGYNLFTFPGLTVTSLTPGQPIRIVISIPLSS